jgi:hypothetical protein
VSVLPVSRTASYTATSFKRRLDFIRDSAAVLHPSLLASVRDGWLQRRDPQMCVMWGEARVTPQSMGLGNPPWWARASFEAYLAWNIAWLASGRIPPSALRALFGLPCPTTGCTRSFLSLIHGNLQASLLWNPFTIPILILLATSLGILFAAALRKKDLLLPRWVGTAWLTVLLAAWFAKFVLGRAYW